MRILSPELGVSPQSNSGGEVYDREILAAYVRAGVEVDLILPKAKLYDTSVFTKRPMRVFLKRIAPPYLFNFLILPALFRSWRKDTILRIHSPYFSGLGILLFRLFHRQTPLIVSYLHVEKFPAYRRIDQFVLPKADHIFTISQSTRKELLKTYDLDPDMISVTYCGIDRKYSPGPKSTEIQKRYKLEGKTVLLYLGGLKARKNLPFLLKVLAKLDDQNVVLLFAGSGPEKSNLENLAAKLGLSQQVRFSGYIEESDKVAIYRSADIFVFPSLLEGFGMVAAEAMACGTPAVVSNVASLPEVVEDGKSGRLVPVNDISAWCQTLKELVASPSLREKLGVYGSLTIPKKFSWDIAAQQQIAVMETLTR